MSAVNASIDMDGGYSEWEFEKTLDSNEVSQWLTSNMRIGLGFSAIYVMGVFAGKKYMEDKPKFNLRTPMLVWSLLLAVFSIFGAVRTASVMFEVIVEEGMRGLICGPRLYQGPITRFWGPVFVFSKVLEYMDTMFIILRKQRLIFLHWYHHLTVSLFAWWSFGAQFAGGGVFMTVNFIVHAMMYTYYAVRAAGIRVPRPIAVTITASQIIQMFIGCWTVYSVNSWRFDGDCKSCLEHVFYGSVMYGSYLILFMHFFYTTYLHPPTRKQDSKPATETPIVTEPEYVHLTTEGFNLRERKPKQP
uniref:Elongation of very long chain fatty acids protein n=1 Tax=Ciona savignyi TaxID=51511 RepID=H2ZFT8_CIOSA